MRSHPTRITLMPLAIAAMLVVCAVLLSACESQAPATDSGVAPGVAGGSFPDEWFFRDRSSGRRYAELVAMEGRPPPTLAVTDWLGQPQSLENLHGQVVVIDFWATWCGPCMQAIPKNVEMVEKHGDRGLTMIGVHDSKRGAERMSEVAASKAINYPLAVDDNTRSQAAWNIRFWPTYFVIDRQGTIRAAGLMPNHLEAVVEQLLAEGWH